MARKPRRSDPFAFFESYFGYLRLDTRSLALFRILLGGSILYNILVVKWAFVPALLGSSPFLPFEYMDFMSGGADYSIFQWPSLRTDVFVSLYMWVYLFTVIAFTGGIAVRRLSLLILFFQFNLMQATNVFITGQDYYLMHLLFFSLFLPLDQHFTLFPRKNQPVRANISASAILLFQIAVIYFFSFLFKYGLPWINGFAVRLMLDDLIISRAQAPVVSGSDLLTAITTYSTLLIECIVPVIIFIKWKHPVWRLAAVVLLVGFHLGIELMSDTSGYSYMGFAAASVLLPPAFWNRWKIPQGEDRRLLIRSVAARRWAVGFFVICAYIIAMKATYNIYNSLDDDRAVRVLKKMLPPSPGKATIFTQNWNMFAPNPPSHTGAFGIVEKREEIGSGIVEYEFVYNPTLNKGPVTWEKATLNLLKINFYRMQSSPGQRNVMAYWADWKIRNLPSYTQHPDDYLLVEFRRLVRYDDPHYVPVTDTLYYRIPELLKGEIRPL